jgi:dolichyl-diphosphooligosaccharide--protein glycosyltransferase
MDFPIRRYKEYIVLFVIFLVALALRLTTARYNLLLEADPWYHFKIASILLESGKYPMYEYYSRYPFGESVFSPPGLYYTPVYLYKIFGFVGVSFFRVFQLLPAISGSLSVAPLYLLTKELYVKRIGFLTALLFAISPAGIERSLAGFYRGEAFMLFTMLFALYFFIHAVKKDIRYSVPAGIFVFASGLLWAGWPMAIVVLTSTAILGVIGNYYQHRNSGNLLISYMIASFLGIFLLFIFKSVFYRYEDPLKESSVFIQGFGLLFLVVVALGALEILNRFLKENSVKPWIPVAFVLFAVMFAYMGGYLQRALEAYYASLESVRGIGLTLVYQPTHVWRLGIAEQQAVSLDYLIGIFSVLLLIAPIGLLFILKEKLSLSKAFSLSFVAILISILIFQVRFTFLASPALCLLGAFPLYFLLSNEGLRKVTTLVIVLPLLFSNTYAATNFSTSIEPVVSEDLYETLIWVGQNTPEDSIILSWWDYTGPINAIADRRTVTHTAPSGIVESMALALRTSSEAQSIEILGSMNEDFVLRDMKIDYILIDERTYSMWPKILMFEPWVNAPTIVENRDLPDSMLSRLYFKRDTSNFVLEFEKGDVKVYRPILNYTRIVEIDTKRYYQIGEEVQISAKTKSNELDTVNLVINVIDPEENIIFTNEEKIGLNSQKEMSFSPPPESFRGTYTISGQLNGPQGETIHSMERKFILIN